jgi:quercetin dioxygenase-like cupin family protein
MNAHQQPAAKMPQWEETVNSTKAVADLIVAAHADTKVSHPEPGLTRRVLAFNPKLFLVEHHMKKGWAGAMHSHPHEQLAYVVSGHIQLSCLGKETDLRTGDSFVVRGGVEHGATALEDSVVVDVFTPWREDYLG